MSRSEVRIVGDDAAPLGGRGVVRVGLGVLMVLAGAAVALLGLDSTARVISGALAVLWGAGVVLGRRRALVAGLIWSGLVLLLQGVALVRGTGEASIATIVVWAGLAAGLWWTRRTFR